MSQILAPFSPVGLSGRQAGTLPVAGRRAADWEMSVAELRMPYGCTLHVCVCERENLRIHQSIFYTPVTRGLASGAQEEPSSPPHSLGSAALEKTASLHSSTAVRGKERDAGQRRHLHLLQCQFWGYSSPQSK